MAVDISDVLAPDGRIEPDLFPGEGDGSPSTALYQRLMAYVNDAIGRGDAAADPTKAEVQWVYWRAFDAKALAMAGNPGQIEQANEGGHAYSPDQRKEMRAQANAALAEFYALVRVDTTPTPAPISRAVSTCYDW